MIEILLKCEQSSGGRDVPRSPADTRWAEILMRTGSASKIKHADHTEEEHALQKKSARNSMTE
jgi:hypothetical protein